MLGARTFSFLGPNPAIFNVNMMGNQVMANGTSIRAWTFGGGFNNDRSIPSSVIEGIEGQQMTVTLDSMMPHSIHLHGLDVDQANDGVPSTSGYVAQMAMGGFGRVQGYTTLGNPFNYSFVAPRAGTYAYHSHVDTVLHFEMGMYGTVIIRPPEGDANVAWAGGPSFDKEYVWHLHTFDSSWHIGGMVVSGPSTVRHRPDYFMINGRDGANTLTDTTTAISADAGETVMIRTNDMGYQPALEGLEFSVIASGGRPFPVAMARTELLVAPGERYYMPFQMPPETNRTATVEYFDIRLNEILGTASTSIQGGAAGDEIFSDDFESGNLSAWSGSVGS
jgi:FtsP/CotA-like multicopper oxidase with cupredoxin domain